MRTFIFRSQAILFFVSALFLATCAVAQAPLTGSAHIGLVYPLSTNGKNAAAYTNHFSLHIIAGVSKAETGVAIAGVSNIIKDSATGVQVAAFSNHTGTSFHSAQVAGFMNHVTRNAGGAEVAGFANIVKGEMNGVQVAGFMNTSANNAGVQVAGFMNKAEEVHTQVAGFINIAKKVKGVQVAGFINIADSSEYPIGLVNIVKGGEKQVSVSIDESATLIAAFKSGGRVLYGILGVGYNAKNSASLYALQGGIGAHLYLLSHFRLNLEATNTVLTDFKVGYYNRPSLGIFPAYRFGRRMEVFAGPTFNHVHTERGVGQDLVSHYIWSEHVRNNRFNGAYIGAAGGVQLRL